MKQILLLIAGIEVGVIGIYILIGLIVRILLLFVIGYKEYLDRFTFYCIKYKCCSKWYFFKLTFCFLFEDIIFWAKDYTRYGLSSKRYFGYFCMRNIDIYIYSIYTNRMLK